MVILYNLISKIAHLYLFYNLLHFIHINANDNDKLMKYMVELSLKIMESYSDCEIFYNKMKKKLNEFINSNPRIKNFVEALNKHKMQTRNIENIEVVKNGEIVNRITLDDFIKLHENNENNENNNLQYDFVIYSDFNNNDDICVNKVILRNDKNYDLQNLKYCETGYKFIMFEIIISDVPISINLSTEKYNYLVIDNVIDKDFFKYYLKKYHHNIYSKLDNIDLDSYKIKIIDHNINILEFSDKPLIICREKGISYLHEKENENSNVRQNSIDNVDDFDNIDIESYNYKYN